MVLKVRIIPSILLMNGIAVKSKQFSNYRPVGSYINAVRVYNSRDVDELVFLDIQATHEKRSIPSYVVREIADECRMPLTIGGGISSISQMKKLFGASADKISINTAALKNPEIITEAAEHFGSANIIVSIDVRKVGQEYHVFSQGGTHDTGIDVVTWATKICNLGAGEIFLTSMDRDGMMGGFDIELIKTVVTNVSVPVIASGGAGKPEHFVDAVLKGGAHALSAASIFHFTQYTPHEIKATMAKEGIPVRLQ
ncbi:Imidazole glycerol phosphate synthase subunit HisF [Candidatus Bilamarchaeum dharawalense]|uniref:Imidazole glycerol phosphate synthase subunit HisF n=1 Tax=Candidatus Bilamarchaeum dharawalense TaxID=2885759 RepID=A0A5E4LTV5_9ARCH|nr:Imidazole glycerol phosphate synthase subunit HisF [Candidatus Bilamarchaeum dharawalense]